VVQQIEGAVAFGLSTIYGRAITFERGQVQQSNFDDYPILTLPDMPAVEVDIVPSDHAPSGVGEMGVPPIVPAVLNALCSATGRRIRHLPLTSADLA